jgi:beta-lactamase superfamily II metal-dependent hydrolase
MRKRALLLLLFFLLFTSSIFGAPSIKIYHIGVGQGDCTLFVIKDSTAFHDEKTFSIIIDGGNSKTRSGAIWSFAKEKIAEDGGNELNFLVVSHLHSDHYGGVTGILEALAKDDEHWRQDLMIVDRLAFTKQYGLYADQCYDKSKSAGVDAYNKIVTQKFNSDRKPITFGQDLLFNDALDHFKMICVASNGEVNGTLYAKIAKNLPKSENDLSFAFVLQFEGFRYFTGGDVGGGEPYSDLETPIAQYLDGLKITGFHACALKVSHHGSEHSTNNAFLKVLNPYLGIIPSALRSFSGTKLPRQSTIDAFTKAGTLLRYTFIPSQSGVYSSGEATSYQDVVISVPALPGYGKPIAMTVTSYQRDKKTLAIIANTTVVETITCNKTHAEK